ncbi:MAG: holo-ACP synthase [Lachnospiraceae bacterium]|nr:holo-ACP synthase [Lachnospiraceae bacterium]
MLTGVGCDLIEIERMKKACEKEAFLLRVYTEEERRQADGRPSVLAGTFAVKEAVAKVLGTGFRTFMPKDVEVLRDELGKPYVILHGNAGKVAEEKRIKRIEVSISDTREFAMAFAVGEGEDS